MNKSVTNLNPDYNKARSIYEFTVKNSKGEYIKLDAYKGHVCIIVNVSSKCAFSANHYAQFNDLIAKYGEDKGLRILAFPCWQFSGKEKDPLNYTTNFDIFEKVDVNGEGASPLWKFLKIDESKVVVVDTHDITKEQSLSPHLCIGVEGRDLNKHYLKQGSPKGSFIKWNFTKFIINRAGMPVERHDCKEEPVKLVKNLESYW